MTDTLEPSPEHLAREEEIRQKLSPLERARAVRDLARGQGREVLAAQADVYSEVGRRIFLLAVEQAGLSQCLRRLRERLSCFLT